MLLVPLAELLAALGDWLAMPCPGPKLDVVLLPRGDRGAPALLPGLLLLPARAADAAAGEWRLLRLLGQAAAAQWVPGALGPRCDLQWRDLADQLLLQVVDGRVVCMQ
jgi:hypothetical protein